MSKGVLVATDAKQQWLLPLWWDRYRSCNDLPVIFVDLGMEEESLKWCRQRGRVLPFKRWVECKEVSWEGFEGSQALRGPHWDLPTMAKLDRSWFLEGRKRWMQKPSICLLSPFAKTLWLDLDCEVLGDLQDVFHELEEGKEIAAAMNCSREQSQPIFNSGVMVFVQKAPLLQKWALMIEKEGHRYLGDDCLLSVLCNQHPDKVSILPNIYNWRPHLGVPFFPKVFHWMGPEGKSFLAKGGSFMEWFKEIEK